MAYFTTLLKAMNGDKNAFISIIEKEKKGLYKVACCYLSNEEDRADAIQETILTCFEKLDTLKEPRFFRTWLIRILINKCKDILSYNKRVSPSSELGSAQGNEASYDRSLIEFWDILERIDEKYRVVLVLYYVEGISIKDIAALTGEKMSTINTRLRRGREVYKKYIV